MVPTLLLLKLLFIAVLVSAPILVKLTVSPGQIVVLSAVKVMLQPGVIRGYVIILASQPGHVELDPLYPFKNLRVKHPDGSVDEKMVGVEIKGNEPFDSTPMA